MIGWRDNILCEFTPKVARLTLVADPDGLLLEEGILEGIRERGFELISFEDPIAFRYAYESKFRSRWDRGEQTEVVVVLHAQSGDLDALPYDLLQAGRKLSFNLGDIFPTLSYPVLIAVDRSDLDSLYEAQQRHAPGPLGDNATKEFILRHVFGVAPELVNQPVDLLRVLLRRHYREQRVPVSLDERFIQILRHNGQFDSWPLETLVMDREAFFTFLQERWPLYLDRALSKVRESGGDYQRTGGDTGPLTIAGPTDLPFDHDDIRIYVDNLFAEGLLEAVPYAGSASMSNTWAVIGVRTEPMEDAARRLDKLIHNLETALPTVEARHTDWFHFARGWAEATVMRLELNALCDATKKVERITQLARTVDERFVQWVQRRFAGLVQLPPDPPVMLHHIPRFLARTMNNTLKTGPPPKIALVVLDGLALDQWLVMRRVLESANHAFRFREQAVFAWLPSLTSVSRQALFSGKAPLFFPDSIHTTAKEPALWTQFWVDQGVAPNEIIYLKGLGDGDITGPTEALSRGKVNVVGLVVDKVDKIMHGMELGAAGMHNQVKQWAGQSFLAALFNLLLDHEFNIFLTSDHGNVEACGFGRPAEGSVADVRGERARVYPDASLRATVMEKYPAALAWNTIGLPEDYLALLAPARYAFISKNKRTVCHGGISVDELIVPFVHIERNGTCQ